MKKIRVKTIVIATMIALCIMMSHDKIMSFASEKDDYIIITKDGKTYDEIIDKYEKKMIN